VSITSFLHAVTRRRSITAPILAQGRVLVLVFTDRAFAAAFVAMFGIAWLAVLVAMAGDRVIRVRVERDTANRRIAELETELAEANTDPVTGLPVRRLAERHLAAAAGVKLAVAAVRAVTTSRRRPYPHRLIPYQRNGGVHEPHRSRD
jgi:hypothetical protein